MSQYVYYASTRELHSNAGILELHSPQLVLLFTKDAS